MFNGNRDSAADVPLWNRVHVWLDQMAASESEAEVFACLEALLPLLGSEAGVYLEAGPLSRRMPGHYRVWPLTGRPESGPAPGQNAPVPMRVELPDEPEHPDHWAAGPVTDSLLLALNAALGRSAGDHQPGGWSLPLRAGRRLLGRLMLSGTFPETGTLSGPMLSLVGAQSALALERTRLQGRLKPLEERVQALARASIGLFLTDAAGQIIWFNPRFQEITGLNSEIQQDLWAYVVPGHERPRFTDWWQDGLLGRRGPHHQFALLLPGGGTRWVEASSIPLLTSAGEVSGLVGTLEDITERRVLQERLTFQAHHDPLTQLPNRNFLAQVWPQLMRSAQDSRHLLALLFIDLERFKQVNDSLGHQVGDQLLTLVARRLQQAVDHRGVVVRHGGDEFVVLLRDVKTNEEAAMAAQALMDDLERPLRIDHHLLRVSGRMGLSLYPQDAEDLPTLLQHADAAMYRLKHARRGGVLAYRPGMSGGGLEQLHLEAEFRQALERGELRVYYQPKVEVASGRQVGWEALVRWQHPKHGLMHPGAFLPMVADANLLSELGDRVTAQVHHQIGEWAAAGRPLLRVAVNIDVRQLLPGHLPRLIGGLQKDRPLPPGLLELEITEEGLPSDLKAIEHDLKWLRDAGVTVAIDDFGRGFSNLGQLQRLHVDRIKIDRSYIVNLEHSRSDRAIVQAAVSVGHALGARVLAEGVESPGQLEVLRSVGCDEGQGTLWAPPRRAEDLVWH